MEMELESYDMEMAAPFSFNKDIDDKIGTNKWNTIDRSEEDAIKEEKKTSTGREDKDIIKNSWSSKSKVESGEMCCAGRQRRQGKKSEWGWYNIHYIPSISHNPQVHYPNIH